MNARHLTTDPACFLYREPRTWLGRRRHDRNRGRSCVRCMRWASRAAFLRSLGFSRGEAAAIATLEEPREW
ncbi:hypothetical protein BJ991_002547 [Microbacterium immunditiarum]|uniref:Uncharacterized protein n=1 Tax=Microbacterium immunditiarum TaxID=337480 RepID=A0A7Y9GQ49_9MICO|nr:hypothetical protein [Microbacterium immunditiarum]